MDTGIRQYRKVIELGQVRLITPYSKDISDAMVDIF